MRTSLRIVLLLSCLSVLIPGIASKSSVYNDFSGACLVNEKLRNKRKVPARSIPSTACFLTETSKEHEYFNCNRRSAYTGYHGAIETSPTSNDVLYDITKNQFRGGSTANGNWIVTLYNRYMSLLDRKPLLTKSITAGIVTNLGNILSQTIEANVAKRPLKLDRVQLAAFTMVGALYVGPFVHRWYDILHRVGEFLKRTHRISHSTSIIAQVFLDQTIGVAVYFPLYFYAYELAEGVAAWRVPVADNATKKMREEIWSLLLMQYRIWPFTNYVNFAYAPQNLRVLFSNIVSVFWNAYLCTKVK